jgi:hypothetical protein
LFDEVVKLTMELAALRGNALHLFIAHLACPVGHLYRSSLQLTCNPSAVVIRDRGKALVLGVK